MPLYVEDTARRSFVPLEEIPASFGDVMEAQFASTVTELPTVAAKRFAEITSARATGPRMARDEAVSRIDAAGLTGALTVGDEGITEGALDLLIERKKDEISRNTTLARARGGFAESSARLGLALGVSLTDPINIASAFVPVFGEARYLRLLKNATAAGRVGIRAGVGAVEGAAGAALIEPLIYSAKQAEQADYDMADSLANIAFGTIFGGGLHVVGGTSAEALRAARGLEQPWERPLSDAGRVLADVRGREITQAAIERNDPELAARMDTALEIGAERPSGAAERVAAAPPEVREPALRAAVGQVAEGRAVDVEDAFAAPVDPRVRISERQNDAGETVVTAASDAGEAVAVARDGGLRVVKAEIPDASMRGQGRGVALYSRLADLAAERGVPLVSDSVVEAPAVRVYEALRKRGYSVEENPAAKALDGGIAGKYVPEGQSVFRVTGRAADAAPTPQVRAPDTAMTSERTAAEIDAEIRDAPDPDAPAERADAEIAEELAAAEQELAAVATRFGVEAEDETIRAAADFAKQTDRWGKIAKAAVTCLMRDG